MEYNKYKEKVRSKKKLIGGGILAMLAVGTAIGVPVGILNKKLQDQDKKNKVQSNKINEVLDMSNEKDRKHKETKAKNKVLKAGNQEKDLIILNLTRSLGWNKKTLKEVSERREITKKKLEEEQKITDGLNNKMGNLVDISEKAKTRADEAEAKVEGAKMLSSMLENEIAKNKVLERKNRKQRAEMQGLNNKIRIGALKNQSLTNELIGTRIDRDSYATQLYERLYERIELKWKLKKVEEKNNQLVIEGYDAGIRGGKLIVENKKLRKEKTEAKNSNEKKATTNCILINTLKETIKENPHIKLKGKVKKIVEKDGICDGLKNMKKQSIKKDKPLSLFQRGWNWIWG